MDDKKTYVLTKVSKRGFVLATEDLEVIYNTLSDYVCSSCINDVELDGVSALDNLYELLGTACGCEFMLE